MKYKSSRERHGMRKRPEYNAWAQMINRCYKEDHHKYPNYGGRGIRVCDRWRESFVDFLEDMGARPSPDYSLDRVDNDGGYNRNNCRWATREQQQSNLRTNVWVSFDGQTLTLAQWSRRLNIEYGTLSARLRRGWPIGRAMRP